MEATKHKPVKLWSFNKSADGNSGVFITGKGAELILRAVPALKITSLEESCDEAWRKSNGTEPPSPPTYIAKNGAEYAYNENSIKDDPDRQPEWENYLRLYKQYKQDTTVQTLNFFILNAVEIAKERDGWVEEADKDGLTIPSNKNKRKLFYVKNSFSSTEEGSAFLVIVQNLGGIDKGVLDKIDAMFQHPLGDTERADTGAS